MSIKDYWAEVDRDRQQEWDKYFLEMAKLVASRSKDPSTQVGAVIVRPDRTVASVGYNGFPRGIVDDKALLENREEKLKRMVHAEMNAILNASSRSDLQGSTLYLWPFLSCERCTVHVIQAGIERVVYYKMPYKNDNWKESWELAKSLYREAGVEVVEL